MTRRVESVSAAARTALPNAPTWPSSVAARLPASLAFLPREMQYSTSARSAKPAGTALPSGLVRAQGGYHEWLQCAHAGMQCEKSVRPAPAVLMHQVTHAGAGSRGPTKLQARCSGGSGGGGRRRRTEECKELILHPGPGGLVRHGRSAASATAPVLLVVSAKTAQVRREVFQPSELVVYAHETPSKQGNCGGTRLGAQCAVQPAGQVATQGRCLCAQVARSIRAAILQMRSRHVR